MGRRIIARDWVLAVGLMLGIASTVPAQPSMPAGFKSQIVKTSDGAEIYVRSGGQGPAVLLIHGFGDTGEMWGPLAAALAPTHTVIVPDLRGMGRSSHPAGGYDKRTQAADLHAAMAALGQNRASVVGHDIGNMVAYAYASRYADTVDRLVVMDAPLPGVTPWDSLVREPGLWHFNFRGPDVERLVAGRERIYLDRFYNEFGAHPERIDEATRAFYARQYAQPGAMHSAFEQFAAFTTDARDNQEAQQRKLTMPVLAIGGEKSFADVMGPIMRQVAANVREATVPDAGHWLMEENPKAVISLVTSFIGSSPALTERRIAPAEFDQQHIIGEGVGTSFVGGIRTVALKGDATGPGLYTIMLYVPAHTKISAHAHPDDRIATVVSGTWYLGYGDTYSAAGLKALPPGSFYTEPPNQNHFAETRDEAVVVQISGVGPSGTRYVDPAMDPVRASR